MQTSSRWAQHPTNDTTFEKHYRIQELAKLWGFGVSTVRRWVDIEPGVCRIQSPGSRSVMSAIPESVARRIHTRMLARGPKPPRPPDPRGKLRTRKEIRTSEIQVVNDIGEVR